MVEHAFSMLAKKKKVKANLLTILLIALCSLSANNPEKGSSEAEKREIEQQWVDSIFNAMSIDERLAQLMMLRAHSNLGADHIAQIEKAVKTFQVGGLCFFQGTPEKQAELTNRYNRLTKHIPLMISMDAEWGLGMRFKEDGLSFPRALMLGAIQDNRLIYEMGKEIARECRRMGVHVNFAPVADVNNNSENPVINTRSFGEDRYNVAAKSYMYMRGMQDHEVMACAKHFPGHGDTDTDSHYDLPVIAHSMDRLDSIELFPFRVLSQHGIQSMMIAHLQVPSIDNTENLPTTLSPKAVTTLLKQKIGFDGLIFTDALDMKGVTKHHGPGEVVAKALVAGTDILLLPGDIPTALNAIKRYIREGKLDRKSVDQRVKRVLRAKYRLGLKKVELIEKENIRAELFNEDAKALKRKLIKNALTLVRNDSRSVPFKKLDSLKIASLSIGSGSRTRFQHTLGKYAPVTHHNIEKTISSSREKSLIAKLKKYDVVVVGLHDMSNFASRDYGLTSHVKRFVENLGEETTVVLVVFGNPYSLKYFDHTGDVLVAYDEDEMTQDLAAQALFGAFSIKGRLPVTASEKSKFNHGITTADLFRMGFGLPEEVGLDSEVLAGIDDIAQEAIAKKATPGCVVLVAKDGQVVFNKAYGFHTYKKLHKVSTEDIYDLASITKIAASTISMMKLQDEGKISIYNEICEYVPELKNTNKKSVVIRDMMAHRAGLFPWIPFYEQTITNSKRNPRPLSKYYSKKPTSKYTVPVTNKLYMRDDFMDEIRKQVYESKLLSHRNYKYSDLGFYMVSDLVRQISGQAIDKYAGNTFYKPMGLTSVTYNPWKTHPLRHIPPTEEDRYFRRQRVHGYVHDMGAAMLGGISGHAGLFSNARDLAVIMQMVLNGGYYGGERYFSQQTVRTFTNRHPDCSRRGIGFDMKETNAAKKQNVSVFTSDNTFGHLGFTGTCTWVDPEHNLIYVFLSNRTYPSMHNYKLSNDDYRPRIQSVIYEALK